MADPAEPSPDDLVLCCFLWSMPGQEAGLQEYEDQVLALLPEHGGSVVQRVRSTGAATGPREVQLLRFPDQDAADSYLEDARRLALADLRDRVIARTELFEVAVLR
ncbi:DUF1330 domain-containing protein [Nocardioides sp. BP30]|uniref:DUF1330 domain-containing protein n=1 Tax=Nocardioides sp. BP30 TaxID=3036374 RepID=UPI002468F62F|nr:DUF1330 domain-containing protein [Nocardioides sp. BP30]WGL52441.1 DUF1330 domain-containing protein [Nocardioides sp. BP30]